MNKLSRVSRNSLIVAFFFLIDKVLAFVRTGVIARQYSDSVHLLDTFNAANNLPDVLFAIISGGALAMAFIPLLTEYLTTKDRAAAWDLFSRRRQRGLSRHRRDRGADRHLRPTHRGCKTRHRPGLRRGTTHPAGRTDASQPDRHGHLFHQRIGDGFPASQPAFCPARAGARHVQHRPDHSARSFSCRASASTAWSMASSSARPCTCSSKSPRSSSSASAGRPRSTCVTQD